MSAGVLCSSRARLLREALPRFPNDTLFHHIVRVVCEAECLPRKELFESWEVARRVRRRFRGGRVVDLASGHGPVAITPKNRLLLGEPIDAAGAQD